MTNKFSGTIYFFSLALFFVSFTSSGQDKPNILWITIEDTSPQYIGAYGNKEAKTPNIDRVAEGGVIFNYAYANGTVCSPARSTIITGVHTESIGTGHHRSQHNIPSNISGFPTYMRQQGYYTTNNDKTDYNTSREDAIIQSSWNESSGQATWRNRPSGSPFFAVFNIFDSHQTRTMHFPFSWYEDNVLNDLDPEEQVSMWEISMPPFFRDTPEMRKNMSRVYNSISLTDKKIGLILDQLEADGLMDETIIFIYADHGEGLPRGKGTPNAQGHRVPFIIRFPEKYEHLSPWTQGETTDEVISFVDLGPTMISLAGGQIPDYMEGRPFLGTTRENTTDHVIFGARNSLGESPGMERTAMKGKYVYSRIFIPDLPESKFMVYYDQSDISRVARRDFFDGKLNENQSILFDRRRPIEFLYNIENDPWELNNLAEDPDHILITEELRNEVYTNMRTRRDAHLFPFYELALLPTPYVDRLDDSKLPISEVMDIVETIGLETSESITIQVEGLNHSHHLVRYWSLIGLRMQRGRLEDHRSAIKNLLNDSYPLNQVQAAGILYRNWKDSDAKTKLEEMAVNDNREISTETMSLIQYFYEDALDFRSTLDAVIAKNQFNPRLTAQSILHFFDGERLSFSENASDGIYDAYQHFTFENDFADQRKQGKLIKNGSKLVYDGVRKGVAQVVAQDPPTFDENFFLGANFGMSLWFKSADLTTSSPLVSLSNSDTSSSVKLVITDQRGIALHIDDQIYESDTEILQEDTWTFISLSYGFESEWRVSINGQTSVRELYPYTPEFITRGIILGDFEERQLKSTARLDDLKIYHFDFDELHDFSVYGEESNPLSINENPYHFYDFGIGGADTLGRADMLATDVRLKQDPERGSVLSLNGDADHSLASTTEFRLDESFTISTWLNLSTSTRWQSVLAAGDDQDFFYFAPFAFGDNPYLVIDGPGNAREFFALETGKIPINRWMHMAITFFDETWTFYLAGEKVLERSKAFDPMTVNQGFIGRVSHQGGSYLNGSIDDFAVFHYALNQREIRLLQGKKVEELNIFTSENITTVINKNDSLQFFFSTTPTDASLPFVSWEVLEPSNGASINEDGLFISGKEDGEVTVQATAIDGSEVTDVYIISQQVEILLSEISISSESGETTITEASGTLQLNATLTPSDADNQELSWVVATPTLGCSIDDNGLLTAGNEEGLITVMAIATDGSETSSSIQISIDLPDPLSLLAKEKSYLYPNPSSGVFQLSADHDYNQLTIYSLEGQPIKQFILEKGNIEINVQTLSPGIYLAVLEKKKKKYYQRLVVR